MVSKAHFSGLRVKTQDSALYTVKDSASAPLEADWWENPGPCCFCRVTLRAYQARPSAALLGKSQGPQWFLVLEWGIHSGGERVHFQLMRTQSWGQARPVALLSFVDSLKVIPVAGSVAFPEWRV